jgi:hypothetical protein
MKKTLVLVVLLSAVALAQQPAVAPPVQATNVAERVEGPTYSDLYCAGFVTNQTFSRANFVAAGLETPHATMFGERDIVYLNGSGYQVNGRYAIVRELRDPNRFEAFPGQRALLGSMGQPYAEMGRVRVLQLKGAMAIARVEFSCQAISPGDLVVEYQEKAPVSYRAAVPFDHFPAEASSTSGRIVMSRDFDMFVASGHKVYLNVGSNQGVKVGDYFRAVRGYEASEMDPADALLYSAPSGVDTQKSPPRITRAERKQLPRRALGEMIVLSVTPTAATAMVTFAVEDIKVGDTVELERPPQ